MAFRYFVGNVETDGYHPGVPARDLEESEFQALPKHLQATVDASPLYRKSKPRTDADHAAAPLAPAAKEEK